MIMSEFSFSRDFDSIRWGPTLSYNLLRAACAGLVLGTLMFLFPLAEGDRMRALAYPFVWPLAYLMFLLPIGLLLSFLARTIPFTGLISLIIAILAVTVGDPIVRILKKFLPNLVAADSVPLFSTNLIIFLLDSPKGATGS